MEARMARLEGAYEQISKRLGGIDRRLDGMERTLDARFVQVDHKFMWVIGLVVTSWLTTISAVLLRH
jgi:hypothetical protein